MFKYLVFKNKPYCHLATENKTLLKMCNILIINCGYNFELNGISRLMNAYLNNNWLVTKIAFNEETNNTQYVTTSDYTIKKQLLCHTEVAW